MANDTNIVVLVGRLTRDIELRYLSSGTAIGRFSLAVNRIKRSGDQREEEVSFFDIVLWGKPAEVLTPYLTKGRQVSISGELRQNRWEQDGQSRSKIEVIANSVQLLGGGGGSSSSQQESTESYRRESYQKSEPAAPTGFPGPEQFDDDIPF